MVLSNATRYPICSIEIDLEQPKLPDMVGLSPLNGNNMGPKTELAPGQSLKLGVRNGTYTFRVFTCNEVLYGGHDVVIDGPLALGLGGPAAAPPGSFRTQVFAMKVPGSSSSPSPSERACKPAGDTSALDGRECCSGSVTSHSAKHPGPSHCSYRDEL